MKIKKIIAIIMAVLLLCTVTSCGKKEKVVLTADEVFAAVEKTAALEAVQYTMDVDMQMNQGHGSTDTKVDGTVKKAVVDGEKVTATEITLDYGYTAGNISVITVGDNGYMNADGAKTLIDAESAATSVPVLDISLLTRDAIESVTLGENEEEKELYTVKIKEGSLDGIIDVFLGVGEDSEDVYENVTLGIAVNDDGYVSEFRFGFKQSTGDTDDVSATCECVFTFDAPGSEVSITLPDLTEYKPEEE